MNVFLNLLAILANIASLVSLILQLKGMHDEVKRKRMTSERK